MRSARTTRWRLAPLLAIATAIAPARARAAPAEDDMAHADRLFKEAKALLVRGMTADACASFAESKRLAPGVGITLYLADCYQRIGRTASAWTEFRSAEALAREHADKRVDLARRRAAAIEPELCHLTIRVTGPEPPATTPLRISYDGKPVARGDWGAALPVDPGEHVVAARAGAWEHTVGVHVDAGTPSTTVPIELPATTERPAEAPAASLGLATPSDVALAPPGAPAPAPLAEDQQAPPSSERFWIAVGLGGAGAVGVGVGAVFGVLAVSRRNQSNAGPCDASDTCSPAGLSLRHGALVDATVSTVGFASGLAALGAGAAVYFLLPAGAHGAPVTVAPAPVAGGAGAVLRTSF